MAEKPENFAVSPAPMIFSEYGRYDALSDVLQAIRLHGGEVSRVSSGDSMERYKYPSGVRMLHMVEVGLVQLSLAEGEHVELAAGDMVVLARGDEHSIGVAAPRTNANASADTDTGADTNTGADTDMGTDKATWLTGEFMVEPLVADPLLSVLTPTIVIRGDAEGTRWLPFSLNLILEEIMTPGPGSRVMVGRLIELLFIRALRAWASSGVRAEPGWLTAAMDPVLGPVMTAIHRSPERDWSVEELAKLAALSRSAFAARFNALLGQPPGTYVLRQRLEHAAHLLRSTNEPVGRIAAVVGYESEAAFSRAFTRAHGRSPRAWRTAQSSSS